MKFEILKEIVDNFESGGCCPLANGIHLFNSYCGLYLKFDGLDLIKLWIHDHEKGIFIFDFNKNRWTRDE